PHRQTKNPRPQAGGFWFVVTAWVRALRFDKTRQRFGQGAQRRSPEGVISAHKAEIINPSLTAKPKNPRPQAGGFLVCGHGAGEAVPCHQSLLPPSIYESLNRPVSPSSKLR